MPALVVIVGAAAVLGGLATASGSRRSTARIYFNAIVDKTEYLAAASTTGARAGRRLFRVPTAAGEVLALAVGPTDLFWTASTPGTTTGASCLFRATPPAFASRRLVCGLQFPLSAIVAGRWVYWLGVTAIGRATLDGGSIDRRFVVPLPSAVGVGQGLTTDGRYLYFSRCQASAIARVGLDGRGLEQAFIRIPGRHCPQGLTYANGYLYWGDLAAGSGGEIGRAAIDGRRVQPDWLPLSDDAGGPVELAVAGGDLFWTWGGSASGPMFIGRATTTGHILDQRYVATFGAEVLAAGP